MADDKPTSYYIFEPLFRVRVPQLQTTSNTYLKMFGVPTTGSDAYDHDLANQLIDTAIPIAKMVEYFNKGIPVYIVKQDDVKTIYEYIERHLLAWKSQLERGLNIGGAPIDDLVAMDAFANSVYEHAKHHFTKDVADNIFVRYLSGMNGGINRNNFISPLAAPVVESKTKDDEDDGFPKRETLSEHFRESRPGVRKWR